jgi:hypothetical protein
MTRPIRRCEPYAYQSFATQSSIIHIKQSTMNKALAVRRNTTGTGDHAGRLLGAVRAGGGGGSEFCLSLLSASASHRSRWWRRCASPWHSGPVYGSYN